MGGRIELFRQNCSLPPPSNELTHGGSWGWELPLILSDHFSLEYPYEIVLPACPAPGSRA
jgi:hypothetical protein